MRRCRRSYPLIGQKKTIIRRHISTMQQSNSLRVLMKISKEEEKQPHDLDLQTELTCSICMGDVDLGRHINPRNRAISFECVYHWIHKGVRIPILPLFLIDAEWFIVCGRIIGYRSSTMPWVPQKACRTRFGQDFERSSTNCAIRFQYSPSSNSLWTGNPNVSTCRWHEWGFDG